jgi:hypothetical protein
MSFIPLTRVRPDDTRRAVTHAGHEDAKPT